MSHMLIDSLLTPLGLMNPVARLATILLAPLVAAAFIALFFRRRARTAIAISVGAAFIIMALSLCHLLLWDGVPLTCAWTWFEIGGFHLNIGFNFDGQAALLLFVVSFVGFWIHLFSVGYMDDDVAPARFFGGLSIFMFSMLGIVFSDNLFMVFIFWELVGFSSYMLIAHYFTTEEASNAAKKAFIVNRVGDVGFLLGILWAYQQFGTVNLAELKSAVTVDPTLVKAGIAFCLMGGFLGKSAQFPLQVWLPDAMAGPTPISALIHAATMVAAGVYFLCRVDFLFPVEVKTVILWLGAGMSLYAGFCALAQRDIKKILAYSTLSQLGYMAAAYGLGYPGLALFHLACHAFFKSLLFLGSGSVIHACHHEQDIFKMGGLMRRMPITSITFCCGTFALCAVTFFSGYYSKDAIIEAAYLGNRAAFWVLMVGAFMTSIYMGRLLWVAFFGEPNSEHAAHAKESSVVMVLPLVVLALLAAFGGLTQYWPTVLEEPFLSELEHIHFSIAHSSGYQLVAALGLGAWVFGLVFTFFYYRPGASTDHFHKQAPGLFHFLRERLWFDELYNNYVHRVQDRVADVLGFLDLALINGFIVRGLAGACGAVGLLLRGLHVGSLHGYVYWFLVGLVGYALYVLI